MNDQYDPVSESHVDLDVREAYRRSAMDSTPNSLNERVLRIARQAVASRPSSPMSGPWLRPLAFAAIAVLCLSVILQFQGAGQLGVTSESPSDAADEPSASTNHGAGDLAAAVETTGQRLRQLNSDAERLNANNKPIPSAATESASRPDAGIRPVDAESRYCEADARISANAWWLCIEELQKDGMDDAARAEMNRFKAVHPLFTTN